MTDDPRSPAAAVPEPGRVMIPLAEVTGDRRCVACGFNLHGQQIVREPHYGMLTVRCPECSAMAALQEYPSLGRWGGRLAMLAAAIFVLVVVAVFVGTCVAFAGTSSEFGDEGNRELAREIARKHKAYQAEQAAAGAPPFAFGGQLSGWEYDFIETAWWNSADTRAIAAGVPDPWTKFDRDRIAAIGGLALLGIATGVFWSVVLSAVRRSRIWVFAILIGAGASVLLMMFNSSSNGPSTTAIMAMDLARRYTGYAGSWMILGWLCATMMVGLLSGRSIARLVVRALLQPRYRGVLGFMWTCDGLPVPSSRAGRIAGGSA